MALAIDASTPAYVGTVAAGGITTASFTPPTGALLVVVYANSSNTTLLSVPTNTGGTISWDVAAKVTEAANGCSAGIWLGKVTASAGMTVSVTNGGQNDWAAGVAVVTGQAATQNGATQIATSASGIPSGTIASLVGTNSLIIGTVANFTNATGPTIPANQSDSFNGHTFLFTDATNAASTWAQFDTRINLAAGASDTINDTAPTIAYSLAMLEIIAASGGGATLSIGGSGQPFETATSSESAQAPFPTPISVIN